MKEDFRDYRFFPMLQELRKISEEADEYVLDWAYQFLKMAYDTVTNESETKKGLAKTLGLSYYELVTWEKKYYMFQLMTFEHQHHPKASRDTLARMAIERLQKESPDTFEWSELEFKKAYREFIADQEKHWFPYSTPPPNSSYFNERKEAISALIRLYPFSYHRSDSS